MDWSFDTSDGPDDSQIVTITATDSDGAVSSVKFQLTVHNVAPTVEVDEEFVTVNEGTQAANSGTFGDAGNDTVPITASVGTVTQNDNTGIWTWSFDATNSPDGSQLITITATDSDGAVSFVTFEMTINNVAPLALSANSIAENGDDRLYGGQGDKLKQ